MYQLTKSTNVEIRVLSLYPIERQEKAGFATKEGPIPDALYVITAMLLFCIKCRIRSLCHRSQTSLSPQPSGAEVFSSINITCADRAP